MSIFSNERFSIGPVAELRGGRSRSDDRSLAGLHSLPLTIDVGVFGEYWLIEGRLRAHVEIRQALRGKQGLVADFAADRIEKYRSFAFSLGPRLPFADGAYMSRSFDVSAAEALQICRCTDFSIISIQSCAEGDNLL